MVPWADRAAEIGGARRLVIRSPHHFPKLVSDEINATLPTQVRRVEAGRTHAA